MLRISGRRGEEVGHRDDQIDQVRRGRRRRGLGDVRLWHRRGGGDPATTMARTATSLTEGGGRDDEGPISAPPGAGGAYSTCGSAA
jgi:hypothetical protein